MAGFRIKESFFVDKDVSQGKAVGWRLSFDYKGDRERRGRFPGGGAIAVYSAPGGGKGGILAMGRGSVAKVWKLAALAFGARIGAFDGWGR